MNNLYLGLTFILLIFAGCKEQSKSFQRPITFIDTLKTFRKEIPTMGDGKLNLFYVTAKNKQKQLGLDSLENGFDNLQIRVWYDFARVLERKLLIIKNKGNEWIASTYIMEVKYDDQGETIILKEVKHPVPISGWVKFSNQLLDLQILTLPDMYSIPGLVDNWKDGQSYNVEVASKMQYRFYGYHMPYEF